VHGAFPWGWGSIFLAIVTSSYIECRLPTHMKYCRQWPLVCEHNTWTSH
jgi:hypothetical protein